jgi:hypothetical protein
VDRTDLSIRGGVNAQAEGFDHVTEYEIDTGAIEALNSIEKRAAIETGQEVDRTDLSIRGGVNAQADLLRKAFTLDELEVMDAKIEAAKAGVPKQIEAPVVVPDVKLVHDKTHTQDRNGVAGRGTEPGKLPGKPECAAPTAPDPLERSAAWTEWPAAWNTSIKDRCSASIQRQAVESNRNGLAARTGDSQRIARSSCGSTFRSDSLSQSTSLTVCEKAMPMGT